MYAKYTYFTMQVYWYLFYCTNICLLHNYRLEFLFSISMKMTPQYFTISDTFFHFKQYLRAKSLQKPNKNLLLRRQKPFQKLLSNTYDFS